jgi:hypothetical protein
MRYFEEVCVDGKILLNLRERDILKRYALMGRYY